MAYLALSLSLVLFVLLIRVLGIVPRVKAIASATREALLVMRSSELAEEEKEAQIQKAALVMFGAAATVLFRIALTFALPAGLILAGTCDNVLYSAAGLVEAAGNWLFIALASVAMIGAFVIFK